MLQLLQISASIETNDGKKKHGSLINTFYHSLTSHSKQKESIFKISNRKEIKSNQKVKKSRLRKNNIFWKIIYALISKTIFCFFCHTILLTVSKCHLSMIFTVRIVIVSIHSTNCYSLDRRSLSDEINIWTSLILYPYFLYIRGHSITTFKQFCLFLTSTVIQFIK